jgi:hypothetical protein
LTLADAEFYYQRDILRLSRNIRLGSIDRTMLKIAALLTAVVGFGLLTFMYDRNRRAELRHSAATRTTAWILSAVGGISLLCSGLASMLDFGVLFGLVAWVGWLAMGALAAVAVLALVVSRIASEDSASQRAPALHPRRPAVTVQARESAASSAAPVAASPTGAAPLDAAQDTGRSPYPSTTA